MNPQDAKRTAKQLMKGLDGLTNMLKDIQREANVKLNKEEALILANKLKEKGLDDKINGLPDMLNDLKNQYEHTINKS